MLKRSVFRDSLSTISAVSESWLRILEMSLRMEHTRVRLVRAEYDIDNEEKRFCYRENIIMNPKRKKKNVMFIFRKIFQAKLRINSKTKKQESAVGNKIEISDPKEFRHIVHWPFHATI